MSASDQPHSPRGLTSLLRSLSTRKTGADATRASLDHPQTVQETPESAPVEVGSEPVFTTSPPAPEGSTTITTAPAASSSTTPAHEEKRDDGPGYLGRLKSLAVGKKAKKPDVRSSSKEQSQPEAEAVIDIKPDSKASVPSSSELPLDPELAELAAVAEEYTTGGGAKSAVPPAEPSALAKLIKTLIDALPPLSADDPVPKPKPVRKGADGKPIPPPDATPVKDPKVIAQLSSPAIMNGSPASGKKSVWSVLETLGPPNREEMSDPGSGGSGHSPAEGDSMSIMLYAPLNPTDDSVVEVAMSELRPSKQPDIAKTADVKANRFSFPWGSKPKPPPAKLVQVWVPSRTKLSIETRWWGYRIYLPPPVLASLGEKEAETAKIAAVITAALAWMINNLPIQLVPLPLQPAVLILKRIAPYLTYIGAFVAWSWAAITSLNKGLSCVPGLTYASIHPPALLIAGLNKGNGVILSATWVLPIALIPGSWPPSTSTPATSTPAPPASAPAHPTVDPSTSQPASPTYPATSPPSSKPGGFMNLLRAKSK